MTPPEVRSGIEAPAMVPGSYYGLAILFAVGLFNYLDRAIISILQVPLKTDLHLSDTQLGMLTGLSFALVYCTAAIPIARLADKVNRKRLIATALTIWSAATGACGFAANFPILVSLRMGVALGEAGSIPATHSIIADYFPIRKRATALALWGLSNPLGTMLGFALGGWLTHVLSWREAFMLFGIAGVMLAPVVLTMREPARGVFNDAHAVDREGVIPFGEAITTLWRLKAFRLLALGGAAHAFVIFLFQNWSAPFYMRLHHLPITQVAVFLALSLGVSGGLGYFFGGFISDKLGQRRYGWYMRLPAIASALLLPITLVQYLTTSLALSMTMCVIAAFLISIWFAPVVAAAQTLVAPQMRAMTSAVLVLCTNLLGLSLGPLFAGMISDLLQPRFGAEALRYAIVSLLFMNVVAALLFWRSAHHLDLAHAERRADRP
jgi:predicted MFS family arabinose efflux permease